VLLEGQLRFRGLRLVGTLDRAWLAAHLDAAKQLAAAPLATE
jgi:hypothetical protein